jgi:eukaryotic-like serine/threonine-protein kinase
VADDLFCPGCNARFRGRDTAVCPRCGVRLDLDATAPDFGEPYLGETQVFQRTDPGDDEPHDDGFLLDQRLDGRRLHVYECETLLGRGCMGHVYLARHTELYRRCALKILSPTLEQNDLDYVQRFQMEGRAAAALVHPNVVTVHAIGESNGYHFLEMEFVTGRSLQSVVDREGALTPVRATVLAAQIAEGLAIAHRHGIVHRDLKPDNVLLTHNGIPKIADFGLAKRIAAEGRDTELCGTPYFMAPELFAGENASPTTDVYALGVLYYVLLTGEVPYRAGSLRALRRLVRDGPTPNLRESRPDIPLEMAECVDVLLSRTPATRPVDAIAAGQLLRAVGGKARDLESLLTESFEGDSSIAWTRHGQRYDVEVQFLNGRSQSLIVEPSGHAGAERLLLIYSVCCEARSDFYEQALRLNSGLAHGGLAIRDVDGEPMFVMVDTYPRATVDAEEVRRSVLEVAYRADEVEMALTGVDRF